MALGRGLTAVPCLRLSYTVDVSVTSLAAGVKREYLHCTAATTLVYVITYWLTTVSANNKAKGLMVWTVDAAKAGLFTAETIESATLYPAVMVGECKGPSSAIKRMNKG